MRAPATPLITNVRINAGDMMPGGAGASVTVDIQRVPGAKTHGFTWQPNGRHWGEAALLDRIAISPAGDALLRALVAEADLAVKDIVALLRAGKWKLSMLEIRTDPPSGEIDADNSRGGDASIYFTGSATGRHSDPALAATGKRGREFLKRLLAMAPAGTPL